MGLRSGAWPALAGLLLVVVACPTLAQDPATVDTCPNAKWKDLPFLRGHSSAATMVTLVQTATGGGDLMTAGVSYLRTNLVPKIGANVFFFALALLFFLFFVLWRVSRWCCYVVCCRASCDEKRQRRDAYDILFSRRMTFNKLAMFVFGLVAIVLYIVGMAGTSKTLVNDAFDTVKTLSDYVGGAVNQINRLQYAVGNITTVIDDFQDIVTTDIDIAGMRTNMIAVETFLTSVTPPATLAAQLTALNTALTTSLSAALTNLGTSLAAVGAGGAMNTALQTLKTAEATAKAMTDALTALDGQITLLPGTGSVTPAITAFSAALDPVVLGMASTWEAQLTAISTAVDTLIAMQAGANPLTLTNTRIGAVNTLVTQIVVTDIPSFSASMTTISSQYTTMQPALGFLITKLADINTTVLELTPAMQSAYDSMSGANTSLAAFFSSSPTPATIASDLSTTTASALAVPSTTAITTALANEATTLNGAQFTGTGGDGATIKAWVTAAKAAIVAAKPKFNTMVTARNTYVATVNAGNYDALANAAQGAGGFQDAATTTMRTKLAEQDNAGSQAHNYIAPATSVQAAGVAAATGLSAFVTSAQASIAGVPALGGYATALTAVTLPPSTVFDGPRAALDAIEAAVVTGGNSAKGQVTSTIASFSGATGQLQTLVVDNIARVETDYKPLAQKVDGYRYQASMVLFALPIAVVLLLLFCALLVNFHFGVNLSVLLLLVLLVLGFLLGAVIAVLLALLGDVCPAFEPIILAQVPANMKPIADYYFGGVGENVTAALSGAGLVDVDVVLAQVAQGRDDVIAGITGSYTFRSGPNAVLARMNSTVDSAIDAVNALLDKASREQLMPVYGSVKGLICCIVPDSFSSMWIAFTLGGIMAWFLVLLSFFYIGKLDSLPRADCLGCSCHTRSRYASTVLPGPRHQAGMITRDLEAAMGHGAHSGTSQQQQYPGAVPRPVGWEDGAVVAELVVRSPDKKK